MTTKISSLLKIMCGAAFGAAVAVAFLLFVKAPPAPAPVLRIGDEAPDFVAETTQGSLALHDWAKGKWVVMLSHPKAFTPVCSTELGVAAMLASEFEKRNAKLLALSVDSLESQEKWVADINAMQTKPISYPLIADADGRIARLYGMLDAHADDTLTVRSVFIIGPDKKIKVMLTYPASTGRSFAEILRTLDSVQASATQKIVTPANWEKGQDVLVAPAVSEQEADTLFPEGVRRVRSYLRYAKQ